MQPTWERNTIRHTAENVGFFVKFFFKACVDFIIRWIMCLKMCKGRTLGQTFECRCVGFLSFEEGFREL